MVCEPWIVQSNTAISDSCTTQKQTTRIYFFLFIMLGQCSHYCSLLLSEQKHFPTLFVRVCRALSCSPSWSIREVPQAGTTTPASNPSLMASGTVSMTSMLARSVSTTGSSRILRMKTRASLSQDQMSPVLFFSTSDHQHCLISLFLVDAFYFLDRSPRRISERLTGGPQGAGDIIPVPLQGWFCILSLVFILYTCTHMSRHFLNMQYGFFSPTALRMLICWFIDWKIPQGMQVRNVLIYSDLCYRLKVLIIYLQTVTRFQAKLNASLSLNEMSEKQLGLNN